MLMCLWDVISQNICKHRVYLSTSTDLQSLILGTKLVGVLPIIFDVKKPVWCFIKKKKKTNNKLVKSYCI